MLPRRSRLHTAREYREMFRRGRSRRGKFLTVWMKPSQTKRWKFGFVVSNRVAKSAVTRNTIKRRLRHAVRAAAPTIDAYEVVVITQPQAKNQSYATLNQELTRLLQP
ncbi:MAG: ribonuclease P protein component [Candidatus Kerfeldbacteria bacterium]|nr:ribonuclease P protein component [Candidatus Kerfeldbacteria bacterium]